MKTKSIFTAFSQKISYITGHPAAFVSALCIIIIWAATGPLFGFNDTWQLVINTGTTIITFLMVFLIQSTQNRDTAAMQIKLDELIRTHKGAHNVLLDLEELSEDDLEKLRKEYEKIATDARVKIKTGKNDTGSARINVRHISKDDDSE